MTVQLKNSVTGVTISVSAEKAKRLDPEWVRADKPAEKSTVTKK